VRDRSFRPPVELLGTWVSLVPLRAEHRDDLRYAARDPEILRYLAVGPGRTTEEMEAYIALLLSRQEAGTDLPFTLVAREDGRAVGMTRFIHIDRENDSVEIGGTWLDRTRWRSPLNTEAKFLMLRHAFEVEGAHRVWLQTDLRNERSQRAIARLGATREGVHRGDRVVQGGYHRSSVIYSVLADEWPRVRHRLERLLARSWAPAPGAAPDRGVSS